MRDFIKQHRREKKPGEPDFVRGFVGFLTYEGEANFVYADEVLTHHPHESRKHPLLPAALDFDFSYAQYVEKIGKIKEYLYAGETYQVNFSQKFEAPYKGDAFELCQKLAAINPSPFQFFMETAEFAVISNSPERLFHVTLSLSKGDRVIETRPIKGTMPRGKTPEEDFANTQKLLASEKDRAELAMIVDLERNDLGKICKPHTVEITEERTIEKYSHVIHTVANIRGVLEDRYDWHDALKALFPGGSVTGCPKKRTMEIIAELEGESRGAYCGSAGWIDLSGDCDFSILIRTLWLENGIITFRSGGGIVVDSDPRKEYEEILHKAAAIARAVAEC